MAPHKEGPADDGKRFPAMDVAFRKGSVSKGWGFGGGVVPDSPGSEGWRILLNKGLTKEILI